MSRISRIEEAFERYKEERDRIKKEISNLIIREEVCFKVLVEELDSQKFSFLFFGKSMDDIPPDYL